VAARERLKACFPLTWKTGGLSGFYVRSGIFHISQFTLKCQEKASECLKYGKPFGSQGSAPDSKLTALESTASTLWIHPIEWHLWLHSIMFGSYLVTIVDQMCLMFGCEIWPKAPGKFYKKLIRRWDSKRELSLRRHRTRDTKYNRLLHKFRHSSTLRLCVGTYVYQIQWNKAM